MKEHPGEAFKELTKSNEIKLTDILELMCTNVYYTNDSDGDLDKRNKKQLEEDIVFNFTNFLEHLDENKVSEIKEVVMIDIEVALKKFKRDISLNDVVLFCTGSKYISEAIKRKGGIEFLHLDPGDKRYNMRVLVNTCNLTLTFPVTKRYTCQPAEFNNNIIDDIYCSHGFGKA